MFHGRKNLRRHIDDNVIRIAEGHEARKGAMPSHTETTRVVDDYEIAAACFSAFGREANSCDVWEWMITDKKRGHQKYLLLRLQLVCLVELGLGIWKAFAREGLVMPWLSLGMMKEAKSGKEVRTEDGGVEALAVIIEFLLNRKFVLSGIVVV
jgi:hypothetical protein